VELGVYEDDLRKDPQSVEAFCRSHDIDVNYNYDLEKYRFSGSDADIKHLLQFLAD
jgi:hypothetical protein